MPWPFDSGLLAQAIAQEEAKKRGVLTNYLPPPAKPKGALQQALDEALSMEGRATFLPFQDTLPGSVMNERSWALPGMLAGAWNAFTAPGRAYSGRLDPTGPEGVMEALNVAGYAALADAPALLTKKATPGVLGANVYHGSPHKFDKFDSSKIGTGEGAQAYGHGLYFAENPQVAKNYTNAGYTGGQKDAVVYMPNGQRLTGANLSDDLLYKVSHGEIKGASLKYEAPRPNLYKVDLPDEMIGKMLDWDAPLSKQPKSVQDAIAKVWNWETYPTGPNPKSTGQSVMDQLGFIGRDKASEAMRQAGIPGIRYLDQGSRTAGKGTYNYVVFPGEENALKILSRE